MSKFDNEKNRAENMLNVDKNNRNQPKFFSDFAKVCQKLKHSLLPRIYEVQKISNFFILSFLISFTTPYDEYIDQPKFTEEKKHT